MTDLHRAIVVPTALSEPARLVTFTPTQLLDVLKREIGCEYVDSSPRLATHLGEFRMWVDDTGLVDGEIDHNDRAIAMCRTVGYNIGDVGGTAVFTGTEDEVGDTLGLPFGLWGAMLDAFTAATMAVSDD